MKPYFITATGTGVGKTLVTGLLARQLKKKKQDVAVLKPVISGFDVNNPYDSDSALLLAAQGKPVMPETIAKISPWRFTAPLSPHLAAAREGKTIALRDVVNFCAQQKQKDVLLIEGVGGVMTPLTERATVLDWMKALQPRIILVCGSYLGSLSHMLTALETLRAHNMNVMGIVVSASAESAADLEEIRAVLSQHGTHDTPLALLPRLALDENIAKNDDALNGYWETAMQQAPDLTKVLGDG